jgi:SAM-dependent methyltransferase
MWYATTRGVLSRKYGYVRLGGSGLLAKLPGRLPLLRARATFNLGVMLHPWKPDGALLDVGCGSGHYLDLMRALGWSRVVGVDIGSRAIRTATGSGLEAYEGELRSVQFPDATFDAVSMSHVLEHVDDPVALLQEVRRVTKPGGRIAIVVPNLDSLASRLLQRHWIGIDPPRHLVNFSRLGLHTALVKAGLSIETIESRPGGSYSVALFSISRARGDPHRSYADHLHKFGVHRRMAAGALAVAEHGFCAAGFQLGEVLSVVARP